MVGEGGKAECVEVGEMENAMVRLVDLCWQWMRENRRVAMNGTRYHVMKN